MPGPQRERGLAAERRRVSLPTCCCIYPPMPLLPRVSPPPPTYLLSTPPPQEDVLGKDVSTFFTFDFFMHETQATPVAMSSTPKYDTVVQYVVDQDPFLLEFLDNNVLELELCRWDPGRKGGRGGYGTRGGGSALRPPAVAGEMMGRWLSCRAGGKPRFHNFSTTPGPWGLRATGVLLCAACAVFLQLGLLGAGSPVRRSRCTGDFGVVSPAMRC